MQLINCAQILDVTFFQHCLVDLNPKTAGGWGQFDPPPPPPCGFWKNVSSKFDPPQKKLPSKSQALLG